jgi:hypothetical protein
MTWLAAFQKLELSRPPDAAIGSQCTGDSPGVVEEGDAVELIAG